MIKIAEIKNEFLASPVDELEVLIDKYKALTKMDRALLKKSLSDEWTI